MKARKLTIIAISIMAMSLSACKDKNDGSDLGLDNVHVDKEQVKQSKQEAAEPSTKSKVQRVATYPKNDASVSNQVAIAEIEKGNPYTSVVSEVEGFRARPYSDVGQGFAVGNGWNMSFQSPRNNRDWAQQAGIAEPMVKSIVAVSGHMQGVTPTGIEITPEQATAVAMAMKPTFEQPAIKLFGQATWNKLQENQKAVLVYHTEKVGPGGAAKYKGLIKAVQDYANHPTEAKAQEVVSHITYGYKIKYPDGSYKQMEDHRSQLYMGALFVDPQQYRYLLGKATAPTGFASTAKTAGFNIDTSKSVVDQVAQQDTFHTEIEALADKGVEPQVQQTIDGKSNTYSMTVPEDKPATAPKPKPQTQPAPQPTAQAPQPAPVEPQDPNLPTGCHRVAGGNLTCTPQGIINYQIKYGVPLK